MTGPRLVGAARVVGFLVALAAIAFAPRLVSDFRASELAYVAIYGIAIVGLNVLTGYTGQISLAHGAFMAIGGYTTAILVVDAGVRDVWTIPLAGLVTALAGLALGVPALRLTGLYLALVTFGIAVATPALVREAEWLTHGAEGINLFGVEGHTGDLGLTILGRELTFNEWLYYLSWSIAVLLFLAAWLILRGRVGRTLRAVRDSELGAASVGINPATYKLFAFALSAFYAGVAGALFAIGTTYVSPRTFPVALSLTLMIGAVIAGLGSLAGVLAGAVFVQFVPVWIDKLSDVESLPASVRALSDEPGIPSVVYGAALIVVVLALPDGAAGLLRSLRRLATATRSSAR